MNSRNELDIRAQSNLTGPEISDSADLCRR
jgi:hypothetical protein